MRAAWFGADSVLTRRSISGQRPIVIEAIARILGMPPG